MIAVIYIDSYKLETFKRVLNEAGYSFTEHPGPVVNTLLLKVPCESTSQLEPLVRRANKECRQ